MSKIYICFKNVLGQTCSHCSVTYSALYVYFTKSEKQSCASHRNSEQRRLNVSQSPHLKGLSAGASADMGIISCLCQPWHARPTAPLADGFHPLQWKIALSPPAVLLTSLTVAAEGGNNGGTWKKSGGVTSGRLKIISQTFEGVVLRSQRLLLGNCIS